MVYLDVCPANSARWLYSKEKACKHFRNLYTTATIVFNLLCAIEQAKFYLASAFITKVGSCGYVIYSAADAHCWRTFMMDR